jgi:hypothetical protein
VTGVALVRAIGFNGVSDAFLDCCDALKPLNPTMFKPIPVYGAKPQIRPRG